MNTTTRRFRLALAALGLMAMASQAEAAFITYTQTALGTGSLGGTSFTNALITITGTADTNNVAVPLTNYFSVRTPGATLTVAGLGSATLTDTIQVISGVTGNGNGNNFAGFGSLSTPFSPPLGGLLLTTTNNSAFATYDLRTAIGPVTGGSGYNPNTAFGTTAGNFVISGGFPTSATFTASFAVPEPSTIALIASAAPLILAYRLRRRGQAA